MVSDYVMGVGFDPGFAYTGIGAVAVLADGRRLSAGVELIRTEPEKRKQFEHLRVSSDDNRRHDVYYDAACSAIERLRPVVVGVETYTIFESREYEHLRDAAKGLLEVLALDKKDAPSPLDLKTIDDIFERAQQATGVSDEELDRTFRARLAKLGKAHDDFRIQRGRGNAAKTYGVYRSVCCAARRYGVPVYGYMPVDLKKYACGKAKASKEEVAAGLGRRIELLHEKVHEKVRAASLHNHVYDASGVADMALEAYLSWTRDGVQHGARSDSQDA
jgi:Holliday junction resolvasome RuvABC endonuclease subunit